MQAQVWSYARHMYPAWIEYNPDINFRSVFFVKLVHQKKHWPEFAALRGGTAATPSLFTDFLNYVMIKKPKGEPSAQLLAVQYTLS